MDKTLSFFRLPKLMILCLLSHASFSQQWNWVSGDSTLYAEGNYTSYWSNEELATPGSRDGSATWTDDEGNLWLFGGFGSDINNELGYLGDLWKFDVATNKWMLVGGTTTRNTSSAFGLKGVPAASNMPSGRYLSLAWKDLSGNFWLYGGVENLQDNTFNLGVGTADLWKYDPVNGLWTFVKGRTEYVTDPPDLDLCYGTMGVEATSNDPLPRSTQNNPTWTDDQGRLWFFNEGEVWRYNIATNCWTWMNGGTLQNGVFTAPHSRYGTKGIPDQQNHPGVRYYPAVFKGQDGNLWLYGGHYTGPQNDLDSWGFHNDTWKYDLTANTWTWMHGDSTVNELATMGTIGQGTPFTNPGGRGGASGWVDTAGDFWMFGGRLKIKQGTDYYPFFRNDLWKYSPALNQWTWMKESGQYSQPGLYGTKLIPADQNTPHSRYEASRWTNSQGFWIFGGNTLPGQQGYMNDLWCFGCDTLKIAAVETALVMPNVFSPNNDGVNDLFIPSTANGYEIDELLIFNRWGEQIFRSDDETKSWNGTINGEATADGVYFWKIAASHYTGNQVTQFGFVSVFQGH